MRPITIITALAIAGFSMGNAVAQQAPTGAQGQPQGQNMAFCLQGSDGSKNCGFATMAQCDESKKGQSSGSTCTRNTVTTGAAPTNEVSQPKTNMQPANPSGPAGSATPAR